MKKLMFFLMIFIFVSCEYFYRYSYEITNETDTNVIIELETYKGFSEYIIGINETKIIFKTDHGIEKYGGPHFGNVCKDLRKCIVMKNNMLSNKNYLDNNSWDYIEGRYKAIIRNDEFR
jgi:hypothetical protein